MFREILASSALIVSAIAPAQAQTTPMEKGVIVADAMVDCVSLYIVLASSLSDEDKELKQQMTRLGAAFLSSATKLSGKTTDELTPEFRTRSKIIGEWLAADDPRGDQISKTCLMISEVGTNFKGG
ncbi:MAG: hypothetical protein R3E18_09535 [Sphingomonadaceae bacterium]|nr:hypothetical protein [Sphingomonadaceae bacterium]